MNFKSIISNSLTIMVLRAVGLCLGVFTNYIIIDLYGIKELGDFSFALSLINFILIFGVLGIDTYFLREISHLHSFNKFEVVKGLWKKGIFIILFSSITVTLISMLIINTTVFEKNYSHVSKYIEPLIWGIIVLSFHRILFFAMRAIGNIKLSVLTDATIPKVIMLLGILFGNIYIENANLSLIYIGSYSFTILITFLYFKTSKTALPLLNTKAQKYEEKVLPYSIPMMLTFSVHFLFLNMDIIMIGFMRNSEEVGVYTVITQVVMISNFFLISMTSFVTPNFSKLYKLGNMQKLHEFYKKSSILSFISALFTSTIIIIFGNVILSIFNIESSLAFITLIVLIIGQLIRSYFGLLAQFLNMVELQNKLLIAIIISLFLNIILNLMLIPYWGIVGAALATSLSLLIRDIISYIYYRNFKNGSSKNQTN